MHMSEFRQYFGLGSRAASATLCRAASAVESSSLWPKREEATPKPAPKSTDKAITHADVRMYALAPALFAIKFFSGDTETFTVMIDCGAWSGDKAVFETHVKDLKTYQRQGGRSRRHPRTQDHVLGRTMRGSVLKNFVVGKIWMSPRGTATIWSRRGKGRGQKKKALAAAAQKLSTAVHARGFGAEMRSLHRGEERLKAHKRFSAVLKDFADLQMSLDNNGLYAGPLAGMKIVKEKIANGGNGAPTIEYWAPGQIIENIAGLEGVRVYVLGPPQDKASIAREDSSDEGETYDHKGPGQTTRCRRRQLGAAGTANLLPFDVSHQRPPPIRLRHAGRPLAQDRSRLALNADHSRCGSTQASTTSAWRLRLSSRRADA